MTERLQWIKQVQEPIDVQPVVEQLEAIMDLVGVLIFEIAIQPTAQAIVAAY